MKLNIFVVWVCTAFISSVASHQNEPRNFRFQRAVSSTAVCSTTKTSTITVTATTTTTKTATTTTTSTATATTTKTTTSTSTAYVTSTRTTVSTSIITTTVTKTTVATLCPTSTTKTTTTTRITTTTKKTSLPAPTTTTTTTTTTDLPTNTTTTTTTTTDLPATTTTTTTDLPTTTITTTTITPTTTTTTTATVTTTDFEPPVTTTTFITTTTTTSTTSTTTYTAPTTCPQFGSFQQITFPQSGPFDRYVSRCNTQFFSSGTPAVEIAGIPDYKTCLDRCSTSPDWIAASYRASDQYCYCFYEYTGYQVGNNPFDGAVKLPSTSAQCTFIPPAVRRATAANQARFVLYGSSTFGGTGGRNFIRDVRAADELDCANICANDGTCAFFSYGYDSHGCQLFNNFDGNGICPESSDREISGIRVAN